MIRPVDSLLSGYQIESLEQALHALREIVQEIALAGLWRGKFFENACFYGGTALRIIHGLNRFSEDMDFTLSRPDDDFILEPYLPFIHQELISFGFEVDIQKKEKNQKSDIDSAFLKMNTRINMLNVGIPQPLLVPVEPGKLVRIKLEVDTNPPDKAETEAAFIYRPHAFSVRSYDLPSMFAGKLHAAIGRRWQDRAKGRDWYDLIWFVSRGVRVNLAHLRKRLLQTGHIDGDDAWNQDKARSLLVERIEGLDIKAALDDVRPFIKDAEVLTVWSREMFLDAATKIQFE